MKLMLWSLSLFLFFVGVLSGVNYVDAQSAHYVECARHQADIAERSLLSRNDRRFYLENLNAENPALKLNGKTCPLLIKAHKAEIKARLERPGLNTELQVIP